MDRNWGDEASRADEVPLGALESRGVSRRETPPPGPGRRPRAPEPGEPAFRRLADYLKRIDL